MIYSATITVPANTTESTSTETDLLINKGLIWLIEFEFPAGCCGLVHVQILDSNYQLFPTTPGENMRGDGILARYEDLYLKMSAPYVLKIVTWNDDTKYDHTIQVRIGMASTEAFMSRYMPSITWDKFSEVLAKTQSEQETAKEQSIAALQSEAKGITEIEESVEQ